MAEKLAQAERLRSEVEIRCAKAALKTKQLLRKLRQGYEHTAQNTMNKVLKLPYCKIIKTPNEDLGLAWNLTENNREIEFINNEMSRIPHTKIVKRCSGKAPVSIASNIKLDTVSNPIPENLKNSLNKLKKGLLNDTDIIAHVTLTKIEMEITRELTENQSNDIWINSGTSPIRLRIESKKLSKFMVVEPGYGFTSSKK